MSGKPPSIYKRYFTKEELNDRFLSEPDKGVDVLIPVLHTNELWESNLHSIYREIPVRRLLIGDGGCIDDTVPTVQKFPRVTVYDHRNYKSLGYSIRKLIEEVQTEWFIYLHSDVWIPEGWFETMTKNQDKYDWFECRQHLTLLLDYPVDYTGVSRPYSGTQMGRKSAFATVLPRIDDDYLYRNEDIIYAKLIEEAGYKYGRVEETFHYHQHMLRVSPFERKVYATYRVEQSRAEEVRACMMQAKGIVKYMKPDADLTSQVVANVQRLVELEEISFDEFVAWAKVEHPVWLPFLRPPPRPRLMVRIARRALRLFS